MRPPHSDPVPTDNMPCLLCGRPLSEHAEGDHTDSEYRHLMQRIDKFDRGGFDPPLPSPPERRRIREEADLTQRDVAAELNHELPSKLRVTHHIIYRWEKRVGYDGHRRLPGREPTGQRRQAYADLLDKMERLKDRFYDA